jgi:hypothetical protein
MPNTKISALPAVTSLATTDIFPVVQGTTTLTTRKATVNDLLSFTPPGFKNLIHNGNFSVDQPALGSQSFVISSTYRNFIDRWICTTSNSMTGVIIAGTAGTGASRFNYRLTSGNASGNFQFGQRIESINIGHLAGTAVTLQAKVASSSLTAVTYTISYANSTDTWGTVASPAKTTIVTGTLTVSATLTRQSVTFTLPAQAVNGIEIMFSSSALPSAATMTFADVQLEAGSAATAFETRPYQTELALCQRYLNGFTSNHYPGSIAGDFQVGFGYSISTTQSVISVPFSVPLRRRPTGITTPSAYTNFSLLNAAFGAGVPTSIVYGSSSGQQQGVLVVNTTAGTPTIVAGQGCNLKLTYVATNQSLLFTGAEMLD